METAAALLAISALQVTSCAAVELFKNYKSTKARKIDAASRIDFSISMLKKAIDEHGFPDLSGANLSGVDLSGANLSGAKLK